MSVEMKDRQILIDGKPQIIMSGEVPYFRIRREDWQDRLDKLKAAGCNAVASYIPWMVHEAVEGQPDLTGQSRAELDVGAFIDLCKANGLHFIARPGPFVMNELNHEGIPGWIYKKHPHLVPVGWDGNPSPTHTLDYLAPDFIHESKKWYEKIMRVLAPRLQPAGGNIIAVQLDNEIGMLSMVSNAPDLTDHVLSDLTGWLKRRYTPQALKARYPFDMDDAAARNPSLRAPQESYAAQFHRDLGHYMRNRFARYVETLRQTAEGNGVRDVPFIINLHGTGNGRGQRFPVAISQLFEAYAQSDKYFAGTDLYLNNLTMDNFQDLHILNAFMHASARKDQPLSSLEFQCGDGDYGMVYGNRQDPASLDFKVRMCIAQGARLINYYNFAGGYNFKDGDPAENGNGRISFIGERYGFCDPVNPEGRLNYMYREALVKTTKLIQAAAPKLASMNEEHDGITFGFIPDHFMTETTYKNSQSMRTIVSNLERFRAGSAWDVLGRGLLLSGFRFGARDIQNQPLDCKTTPVLILPSAGYMDSGLQQKLVDWMHEGGNLFLYGQVPEYDMEGKPCAILARALDVQPAGVRQSNGTYRLTGRATGWAAPRPDITIWESQIYRLGARAVPFIETYDDHQACAFETTVGKGRAAVMGTSYCGDLDLFKEIIERMGARPGMIHDCDDQGVYMTSTVNAAGERFLHILNLDYFEKTLKLTLDGKALFDGKPVTLQSRGGLMLPVDMAFEQATVLWSTAEVIGTNAGSMEFRLTQARDEIILKGAPDCLPNDDYTVTRDGDVTRIVSRKNAKIDNRLVLNFRP